MPGTHNQTPGTWWTSMGTREQADLVERLPKGVTMQQTTHSGRLQRGRDRRSAHPRRRVDAADRSLLYKVEFYYKAASDPTEFWMSEAKRWSKDVDKFAEPSKTIQEAVSG